MAKKKRPLARKPRPGHNLAKKKQRSKDVHAESAARERGETPAAESSALQSDDGETADGADAAPETDVSVAFENEDYPRAEDSPEGEDRTEGDDRTQGEEHDARERAEENSVADMDAAPPHTPEALAGGGNAETSGGSEEDAQVVTEAVQDANGQPAADHEVDLSPDPSNQEQEDAPSANSEDDEDSGIGAFEGTEEQDDEPFYSGPTLVGEGPGVDEEEVEDVEQYLKGLVEAIIFSSDKPQTAKDVARAARLDKGRVQELIDQLILETTDRGVRLVGVADGYAFRTNPAYSNYVREFLAQRPVRLSRAQLETLAIIAYRQPLTRPEVDDIRGVDSGAVIKVLLERELIRVLGKKDEPGRPMIYGTTNQFLELFSLSSLRDLPTLREFTELSDDSRAKFESEVGEPAPEGPIDPGLFDEPSEESEGATSPAEAAIAPEAGADSAKAEAHSKSDPAEASMADDDDGDAPGGVADAAADEEADVDDSPNHEDEAFEAQEDEPVEADTSDEQEYQAPALSAEDEAEFPDDDDEDDDDEDDDEEEDEDDDD